MAKKQRKLEAVTPVEPEPSTRPSGAAVALGLWWLAAATLALSLVAYAFPEARLWAVHQFAFLHPLATIVIVGAVALLLTPVGAKLLRRRSEVLPRVSPWVWAGTAFVCFMLLSVYGNLLGDGQLALSRLAHIGDMLESGKRIPPGRFFAQKEPGTMMLHEGAFRVAMEIAPPKIYVAPGAAGMQARVERQLEYRGLAQWCFRFLSSLAGALLVLLLLRFTRTRKELDGALFLSAIFACGAWLLFFGYVENYAWVSLLMIAFLMAGLKAAEPPRRLPLAPLALFALAVFMHYMAIVLLPALVFLLWTLHVQPRDEQAEVINAPRKRAQWVMLGFAVAGLAGYFYVKGWRGWISIIPLLPRWEQDGYALLTLKHGADLVNLLLWTGGVALLALFFSRRLATTLREHAQESFLLLAAGSGALFALVFSPNLGMARDWDIVSAALWPLIFWGAWRLAQLHYDDGARWTARASLLALTLLLLAPAVLVQAREASAIERFRALLHLDRSRSSYGWENLALYYQRTGDLEQRIAAWREALVVEENPRYVFNLAEALRLHDEIGEADSLIIRAATLNQEYVPNLFYYAVAQAKLGRYDRTKAIVDTALALKPDVPAGASMSAWAKRLTVVDSVAASGDTTQALMLTRELMKLDSANSFWKDYEKRLLGGK